MRLLGMTILCGILCLSYSRTALSAEVTIVENSVFVKTDTYQVQFLDGAITHLSNKLTGETYTLPLVDGVPSGPQWAQWIVKKK